MRAAQQPFIIVVDYLDGTVGLLLACVLLKESNVHVDLNVDSMVIAGYSYQALILIN